MKRWSTVQDFIASGKAPASETVAAFEGFASKGDGGASFWVKTGSTGVPSQSPTDLNAAVLTDSQGVYWRPTSGAIFYFDGTNQWFPAPFGNEGAGLYQFDGVGWNYYEQAGGAVSIAVTTGLITNEFNYDVGTALTFAGYSAPGDGGGAQWVKTATIDTPSQNPVIRGDGTLTDALGYVWEITRGAELDLIKIGIFPSGSDDSGALSAVSDLFAGGGEFSISKPYLLESRWRIQGGSDFKIAFKNNGKLTRIGGNATVLEINECNDFKITDAVIDGGGAGGSHGIVISDCNRGDVVNAEISNHTNTAILAFSTDGTHEKIRLINCKVYGKGDSNNGLFLGALNDSHIIDGYAEGCRGAPGFALQMKDECAGCTITGTAKSSTVGAGFGREAATGVKSSSITALITDCSTGFSASGCEDNTVNLNIDMNETGQNAIDLQQNCVNNYISCEVHNMDNATVKSVARLIGDAGVITGNIIDINSATNTYSSVLANFGVTATSNTVNIKKWDGTPNIEQGIVGEISNLSTGGTNTVTYGDRAVYTTVNIAAGEISLPVRGISYLAVDTEGGAATDDLDVISGTLYNGDTLVIRQNKDFRDTTIKHNTGNILLSGSADFTLGNAASSLTLTYNSTLGKWTETSRTVI